MIWLIGCKGMLGSEVSRQLEEKKLPWVGTDREVDITDINALDSFATSVETASFFPSELKRSERKINWIINCSAYTNVDKAEEETDLANSLNNIGAMNIARVARSIGAKLIHISTDYVFDGTANEPYQESMPKAPLGVYGVTKSKGEDAIQKEMNTYYIIRTAWLYGFDGKNFVYTMTNAMNNRDEVKVVNDQIGSPTCAVDLAQVIIKIIEKSTAARSFFGRNSIPAYGIYHFTNMGQISWFDFATKIYQLGKKYGRIEKDCQVNSCTTEEFGAKVKRPAYSVLSKDKISNELKIKIPDWKTSLEKFIKDERFKN